jgi:ankyrin repeat protein
LVAKYEKEELETHLAWLKERGVPNQAVTDIAHGQIVRPTWFWAIPMFQKWEQWSDNSNATLLFCPGQLGAGKTVFAQCVAESLREKYRDGSFAVCDFYFNYKQHYLHTVERILGHTCYQILLQKREFLPTVKAHREEEDGQAHQKSLFGLAKTLLFSFEKSFIIFDAFDECDSENAEKIMVLIRKLLVEVPNLRILVTGRHSCQSFFQDMPSMEVSATNDDIETYIRSRLPTNGLKTPLFNDDSSYSEVTRIVKRLVEQSGGRFLLARSHMNAIQGSFSLRSLQSKIEKLGADINEVYEQCLERIKHYQPGDFAALGITALLWVVHARYQLKLDEVLAIYVASNSKSDFDDATYEELSQDHLIASTAGLIQINEQTTDLSIHKSLQDYLEQGDAKSRHFPDGQFEVARLCLRFLQFDRFSPGSCNNRKELTSRYSKNKFFRYAALNWGHHLACSDQKRVLPEVLRFFAHNGPFQAAAQPLMVKHLLVERWFRLFQPKGRELGQAAERDPQLTPLHVAAYFNLCIVARELIDRGYTVDSVDKLWRTPLHIACMMGHTNMVMLLLQEASSINFTDVDRRTCLHAAAANGHQDLIVVLLKYNSQLVFAKGTSGQTALFEAIDHGYIDAVQSLVKAGSKLDERLKDGRNILHLAAALDFPAAVELVFQTDNTLAWKLLAQPWDDWGDRPIHSAAYSGHPRMLEFFIRLGVDMAQRQGSQQTPLHICCQHGRYSAAAKLLDLGADPNVFDETSMTPLHHAARNGHIDILRLLLQHKKSASGIDLRCQPHGNSPLHLAAASAFGSQNGYYPYITIPRPLRNKTYFTCFHILYESGANINMKNDLGLTALDIARESGNDDIIAGYEAISETRE